MGESGIWGKVGFGGKWGLGEIGIWGKMNFGRLRFGDGKFRKGIFCDSSILVIWDFGKMGFVEGRIWGKWDVKELEFWKSGILGI